MNDSIYINETGDFNVIIKDPHWEALDAKNGDDCRMALVCPLERISDGKKTTFRFFFTSTIAQSGRNRGRAMFEINAEAVCKLGMSEPFAPNKIDELDGVEAIVSMQEDVYEGQTRVVARFLDPAKRETLSSDKANDIWAKMKGGSPSPKPPSQSDEDQSDDHDDHEDQIPF